MSNVAIRPGSVEDVPRLTEIYNYYVEETATSFDLEKHCAADRVTSWFSNYSSNGIYRIFVAELDGLVVGYCTSSQFRVKAAYATSVETSVYLDKEYFGRGIGSKLYNALFASLIGTSAHRAYGGVTLPNAGSVALHKNFGFREVGIYREVGFKLGRFHDVCWFEKEIGSLEGT